LGEVKMRVRYDREHDILYIDLSPRRKACDTQLLNDDIFIDLDEDNNIVGIEIWRATENIIEPIATEIAEKVKKVLVKMINNDN